VAVLALKGTSPALPIFCSTFETRMPSEKYDGATAYSTRIRAQMQVFLEIQVAPQIMLLKSMYSKTGSSSTYDKFVKTWDKSRNGQLYGIREKIKNNLSFISSIYTSSTSVHRANLNF
jgi:hypothetical protein